MDKKKKVWCADTKGIKAELSSNLRSVGIGLARLVTPEQLTSC